MAYASKSEVNLTLNNLFAKLFGQNGDSAVISVVEDSSTNTESDDTERSEYDEMMNTIKSLTEHKEAISSFNAEIRQFSICKIRPPQLDKLYKALLTIRPSSVASERVFSVAGNIITKTRSRLDRRSADALVFLKCYLNSMK